MTEFGKPVSFFKQSYALPKYPIFGSSSTQAAQMQYSVANDVYVGIRITELFCLKLEHNIYYACKLNAQRNHNTAIKADCELTHLFLLRVNCDDNNNNNNT